MENKEYVLSYYQGFEASQLVYPNRLCKLLRFRASINRYTSWTRMAVILKPNEFHNVDNINKCATIIHEMYPNTNSFQLEEGSYPTSYIACKDEVPTTRPADYLTISGDGTIDTSRHRCIIETDEDGKRYLLSEPQRTNYITKEPK